ncbi:palmitoyltransferase ZDHHC15B-like [Actinia tenebrosa]|uniref:Palmitoyltransferase n=1 Tax=Actinia tenebrosa TaxID=6105 RepID=A0A6P8IAQ2_ACTTE|nr:palmitoyltransferase ZDHHC15B-like [Actinia tenebrosa]
MAFGGKVLGCLVRFFQWIPVVFINSVIVWSYYAYVFILCFESVKSNVEKAMYLIFYHPFFLMLMVSYWRTILTDIKSPPSQFSLSEADKEKIENGENAKEILERFSSKLPTCTRTMSGGVRYCDICNQIKPDRCHHCSMCRKCVLKMDHHCPWVNNCVCYFNYKFFILFLFYAILYTLYVTATVTKYFLAFWNNTLEGDGKLHILFLFFVAIMFCISLWSLFGYHVYLTTVNKTTLESFRVPYFINGPDKKGFNLGSAIKNVEQVFGTNRLLWFLPIKTSLGDGVRFPLNHRPESDRLLSDRERWMEEGELDTPNEQASDSEKMDESTETIGVRTPELSEINEMQPTVSVSQNVRPDVLEVSMKPQNEGTTL